MTARLSILRRVEALEASASIEPPNSLRAQISAEVRALLAAVPHEDDRAALLGGIDDGTATDTDHIAIAVAGCSLDRLRGIVELNSRV